MKTIKALSLQTWSDISIQETGEVYSAHAIALANGKSISSDITPGQTITIPDGLKINSDALQYFKARNIIPASGIRLKRFIDDYELPNEFPISL